MLHFKIKGAESWKEHCSKQIEKSVHVHMYCCKRIVTALNSICRQIVPTT